MLKIRPEQQQVLADNSFQRRVVELLREVIGHLCPEISETALALIVARAIVSGREIGVTTERELAKWALIGLLTRGNAFEQEDLKAYILSSPPENKRKIGDLLDDVLTIIQQQA